MEGRCFLFLLFLVLPALTQAGCPDGWVEIDDCCYYFSDEKVSYSEAKYECEEYLEGDLVAFDDCDYLESVLSSAESCPYWIHPTTDLDCLEPYPEEENKYICKIVKETDCEAYCNGTCWEEGRIGCSGPVGSRSTDPNCGCADGYFCCVPPGALTCMTCGGQCRYPDPDQDNLGCDGMWKDDADCSCPYNMRCCCKPETECEEYCDGKCLYDYEECTGDYEWALLGASCSCPENKRCCVPKMPSCRTTCKGECLYPDEECIGDVMDADQCPCPYDKICCCHNDATPEPTPTPCPMPPQPPSTDEHGCGLPEVASIPDDKAFDFEAMYETLTYAESDPYAAELKLDEVKEQYEKLSYKDGESLSGMSGDLTDGIRAERDVWVIQYNDAETGYEIAIMLPDFDPRTGVLPEELDFSGLSVGYGLKEKLNLLKERYVALRLTVHIPDYVPNCDIVIEIQLNVYFSLLRVPLVLVPCVSIECEALIIIPVICYHQYWLWVGDPVCEWFLVTRCYIKYLIIRITFWVTFSWIRFALPPWAVQPLPDCPAPGLGAIAPFEGYNQGFLDRAMDNFKSSLSEDMATELRVDEFRFVYDEELQGRDNTALLDMQGGVTSAVNGEKDKWVLTFKESDGDLETSILLDDFDPYADELPDAYDLGDLSAFGSYSQRYLQLFSYRYMEMRATVSLRAIFPTNCGTAVYSVRLDARFTLRRLPFFLLACWEIQFTEFLIVPVPCYEIYIICGIRVVIPVIKVIIIRRSFWFGLWVFIPRPVCPWPPAALPGSAIAWGSPTGFNNGDICTYVCLPGFRKCKGFRNLVCWNGQWRPQNRQLMCGPICPVAPPPGFGAVRVGCRRTPIFGLWAKEVCIYRCLNGWRRWKGSYVRMCRNGIWTGSPLICFPPWIPGPIFPCDCKDIHDMDPAAPSGVYMVYPMDNQPGFLVYCDMDTDGGGWTVIQRRQDGSVDFYRGWDDYKHGFPESNMTGEFWLGNEQIHRLTVQPGKDYVLRVDLEANDETTAYAVYNYFGVNFEGDNYRIIIAGYSGGTAGDSMTAQDGGQSINQQAFSTFDDDNDVWNEGSCANRFMGAWWYCACSDSNLNGMYGSSRYGKGVVWKTFRGMSESLPFTEMKIRP